MSNCNVKKYLHSHLNSFCTKKRIFFSFRSFQILSRIYILYQDLAPINFRKSGILNIIKNTSLILKLYTIFTDGFEDCIIYIADPSKLTVGERYSYYFCNTVSISLTWGRRFDHKIRFRNRKSNL